MPRPFLAAAALLLLTACSTARTAVTPGREAADLLITGGTVLTMAGPNLVDGAIAVRDGEIVAVGTSSELAARYAAAEVVDARGRAVLPGFVNAHTHVPMTLFRGIADDRDLMEWLQKFIFPAEAQNVDRDFVRWGTRLAAAEMIASGTTTYADMYYFEADIADETRRAGLRGVLGETLIDFPAPDNKTWAEAIRYSRSFIETYRNDPLITAALAPHAPYTVSAEHLREVRALATEHGAPILIHVAETQDEVRQVAEKVGRHIGIMGDLQGPKIRIESFKAGPVSLTEDHEFTLDVAMDPNAGDEHAVGCAYRKLPNDVVAGDTLLLDDGLIVLEVELVEDTRIHCRVKQGGRLADHKGLNKQGGGLSAPALTDKDRRDIESAARLGLDFMSVSFARNAEDMEEARRLLRAAGGHGHIVAKIERAEAVTKIRSIIDASDVIMVARGCLEFKGIQHRNSKLAEERVLPLLGEVGRIGCKQYERSRSIGRAAAKVGIVGGHWVGFKIG